MSNDTPETVDVNTDDLDAFSLLMSGQAKPAESTKTDSNEDIEDDDTLAPEAEDEVEAEDTDDEPEVDETDDEPEPEPKPEKKKSRFQERIDELTADKRAEREAREALQKQLDEFKAKFDALNPPAEEKAAAPVGPHFTDVNDDGSEKYPLGEYDPMYVRDLARLEAKQAFEDMQADRAKDAEAKEAAEVEAKIVTEWQAKLPDAREKYEEYDSSVENLTDAFRDLDPAYGNYLASTIMTMEFGPDVLYYLANNLTEAKKIASSGPTAATIALGRLEALFALDAEKDDEPEVKQPKVSNAPKPAPILNKGTVSNKGVRADTDDLEAFEAMFFKKKK